MILSSLVPVWAVQAARFLGLGIIGVGIDAGVFSATVVLSGSNLVAKPAGYLAGLFFMMAFVSRAVFLERRGLRSQLTIALVSVLAGFLNVAVFVAVSTAGLATPIAFLLATFFSASANFFSLRFFIGGSR